MFFQFFITTNSFVKITITSQDQPVATVATDEVIQPSNSLKKEMEEMQDRIYSLQVLQKRIEEKQQKPEQ